MSIKSDPTIDARRASRLTYAKRRVQRIVDTDPQFTRDELEQLAAILLSEARNGK